MDVRMASADYECLHALALSTPFNSSRWELHRAVSGHFCRAAHICHEW